MIHEQLDLQHWKHICSLQRLRDASGGKSPAGGAITGPCDIAALEQLRNLSYAHLPDIKRVPTDIFIWFFGETDQRMVTKIGGLPYRAANKPWPRSPSGIPLTFVAQICFADSHDLTPELPGDVLLIFTEARNWGSAEEPLYDFMGEAEETPISCSSGSRFMISLWSCASTFLRQDCISRLATERFIAPGIVLR